MRRTIKPILEVLVGVPTVVFGYFALTFVTPELLQDALGINVQIFNALSAGVVMGIMIVPTIASISEDAMRAVPQGLREGAYGLGSTKRQVATRVVFPAAISGIVASIVLGVSRGVGETMIVLIAAGLQPNFGLNPTEGFETITTFMGSTAKGDNPAGTIGYEAIFACGLTLFVLTLVDEHDRDPLRPQVPRGIRVMRRRRQPRCRGAGRAPASRPAIRGAASRRRSASRRAAVSCSAIALLTLVVLLVDILAEGIGSLSTSFLTDTPSRIDPAELRDRQPAIVGTLLADARLRRVHHSGGRRQRDLPRGVREPRAAGSTALHRGQHPEPRRGPLDRLRRPRPGVPRPRPARARQRRCSPAG